MLTDTQHHQITAPGSGGASCQKGLSADDRQWLKGRFGESVKFNEPMARHTYFQIGGPAEAFVFPTDLDGLIMLVLGCRRRKVPYLVIGGGTNLLVKDKGISGVVIAFTRDPWKTDPEPVEGQAAAVIVKAGTGLKHLCRYALNHDLEGMNFALGIPGSVGGAIIMNAGTARGAVAGVLSSVTVLEPDGSIKTIRRSALNFKYRELAWHPAEHMEEKTAPIILEGRFRLSPCDPAMLKREAKQIFQERASRQPMNDPSAGCFFKNPLSGPSAGELIDRAGLKGESVGGASVSSKHANFILNDKRATAADVLSLAARVQEVVEKQFGTFLEPEVKIVGH